MSNHEHVDRQYECGHIDRCRCIGPKRLVQCPGKCLLCQRAEKQQEAK